MSEYLAAALEAANEWSEAEVAVFCDIRDNHPRKLAKYMAQRNDAYDANLAKTAAEFEVDPADLRAAMVEHALKKATVGTINGVSFVGFGMGRR